MSTTTTSQIEPGSNRNEGVLHIPKSLEFGTPPSDTD